MSREVHKNSPQRTRAERNVMAGQDILAQTFCMYEQPPRTYDFTVALEDTVELIETLTALCT